VSCGAAFAPSGPFPNMSLAFRGQQSSRQPALAGFTKIKHDGFRIIAHRSSDRVQLVTRAGNNFASRFPLVAAAIAALPIRSCVIDGEAIACDENGLSVFDLLHHQRRDQVVTLCAFDLIELDGEDLRPDAPSSTARAHCCGSFATGIPASLTVPSSSKTPARLAVKAS
jgi:bifunctional non-homologous end joining protein LigD